MANNEQRIKELREQLRKVAASRAGCMGDPDCLRDLDETVRELKEEIRQLGG